MLPSKAVPANPIQPGCVCSALCSSKGDTVHHRGGLDRTEGNKDDDDDDDGAVVIEGETE